MDEEIEDYFGGHSTPASSFAVVSGHLALLVGPDHPPDAF
jgi:hypothetical protein